jgi:hypothetical protein
VKKLLALISTICISGMINAQIYTQVDTMPVFPGGHDSLMLFLKNNTKYPVKEMLNELEGNISMSLTIDTFGKAKDFIIHQGVSQACDGEAMRVLGSMPPWKVGILKGKKVEVQFTFQYEFKIDRFVNRYIKNGQVYYREPYIQPKWFYHKSFEHFADSVLNHVGITLDSFSLDLEIIVNYLGMGTKIMYSKSYPKSYLEIKPYFEALEAAILNNRYIFFPAVLDTERVNCTMFKTYIYKKKK